MSTNKQEWINFNGVFLRLSADQILTLVAYGEARGESVEGILAIINVVRNRVRSGGWFIDEDIAALSTPVHGVILKKWQFSCFNEDDPNRKKLKNVANVWLAIPDLLDSSLGNDIQLLLVHKLVKDISNDNTFGATHYHSIHIAEPSWVSKLQETTKIGSHIFYK